MKKGIILSITLIFILTISTLIIFNLSDTNNYIIERNKKLEKLQLFVYANSLQKEISHKLFMTDETKQVEFIEKYFTDFITFEIESTQIIFKIKPYSKIDINNTNKINPFLRNNGVFSTERLKELLKKYPKIDSQKKLNYILNEFSEITNNKKIFEIENEIGFFDIERLYELFINLEKDNHILKTYYVLDSLGMVKHFEITTN